MSLFGESNSLSTNPSPSIYFTPLIPSIFFSPFRISIRSFKPLPKIVSFDTGLILLPLSSSKSEYTNAIADPSLMVIDCFATWCGPCKVIAPEVVKLSKKYTSTRFYKLDVDDVPDVAHELGVRAMPTFLLFKNGQKVGEVVGANKQALEAAVEKYHDGVTA